MSKNGSSAATAKTGNGHKKREILRVKGKTIFEIVTELRGPEWGFGNYASEFVNDLQNKKINIHDKKWLQSWGIEDEGQVTNDELQALRDSIKACKI